MLSGHGDTKYENAIRLGLVDADRDLKAGMGGMQGYSAL
jgi:hypothetical protein